MAVQQEKIGGATGYTLTIADDIPANETLPSYYTPVEGDEYKCKATGLGKKYIYQSGAWKLITTT